MNLLIAKDNTIPLNLSPNGIHYIEYKHLDGSAVDALLEEMCQYGKSIEKLYENVLRGDYCFSDLCKNSYEHRATVDITILKKMVIEILCSKSRANYQKLPFMYMIYRIGLNDSLQEIVEHDEFRKIIANYYIYAMLFTESDFEKDKYSIDTNIKEAFNSSDTTEIINGLVKATRQLRKEQVDRFSIPQKLKVFERQAFVFSIIDYYDCDSNFVKGKYSRDDQQNHNQEHFIIPDSHKKGIDFQIEIDLSNHEFSEVQLKRIKKQCINIELDSISAKERKNHLINYIIIPERLNGSLQSYDIVTKIDEIQKWYIDRNEILPRHLGVYIEFIKSMPEYCTLTRMREELTNELQKDIGVNSKYTEVLIKKKEFCIEKKGYLNSAYNTFMDAYFNNSSESILIDKLNQAFISSFIKNNR